jgi:hypothetical protein
MEEDLHGAIANRILQIPMIKLQTPNKFQLPNIQMAKRIPDQSFFLNLGHWNFGYYLIIGAWNLVLMNFPQLLFSGGSPALSPLVKSDPWS